MGVLLTLSPMGKYRYLTREFARADLPPPFHLAPQTPQFDRVQYYDSKTGRVRHMGCHRRPRHSNRRFFSSHRYIATQAASH